MLFVHVLYDVFYNYVLPCNVLCSVLCDAFCTDETRYGQCLLYHEGQRRKDGYRMTVA